MIARIMILDKGKHRHRTKDELKKMVSIGEKVIVETAEPTESILLKLGGRGRLRLTDAT